MSTVLLQMVIRASVESPRQFRRESLSSCVSTLSTQYDGDSSFMHLVVKQSTSEEKGMRIEAIASGITQPYLQDVLVKWIGSRFCMQVIQFLLLTRLDPSDN